MLKSLVRLPLALLRKTLAVTVPLLAVALVSHLLTPGQGWGQRGLTALGTALGDAHAACLWLGDRGTATARYWDPAPSEAAQRLAEHVRTGAGWKCQDAKQAVLIQDGATVLVLDLANNVVGALGPSGNCKDVWPLGPGDVKALGAALADRYESQQTAERLGAVRAVTDRITAKSPAPAGQPTPTEAALKVLANR